MTDPDPKAALTEEELAHYEARVRGWGPGFELVATPITVAHMLKLLATARRCAELEAENGRLINDRDRFLRLLERALPELDRYEGCDHELESAIRKALEP